jgi:TolA-binding protein
VLFTAGVFALLSTGGVAAAAPLSQLSGDVSAAVKGALGEEREQALFGHLGDTSVQVAERYDQWVRTGSGDARSSANSSGRALLPLLERLRDYHQSRVDKAVNDIIAIDGNPEILYEQRPWLVDRGFALAACGQLSWLYYRLAMLNPEEKTTRRAWLEKSVKCFSEFVYDEDVNARDENLLGRALAERELGELDAAAGDLAPVLQRGPSSPLYWPARLTLAEVRVAKGGSAGLEETRKLLAEASGAGLSADTRNQIRLLRFQALAEALKGGASGALTDEAQRLARELTELGAFWSKRVQQIALATLPDPRLVLGSSASAEWMAAENLASEEKFEQAIVAYEKVRESAAPDSEQGTLVYHRLGVSYFRLGRFADAERALRNYLDRAPTSSLAAEAAYLRFRAAEGVFRATPSAETRELFLSATEAYLDGWPEHDTAYEAALRLGELHQADGRLLDAADAYARVRGPAAFEIRAAAGEVQCLADVLLRPPEGADAAWASPLRARVADAWARFSKLSANEKGAALDDLRARSTLAKAMAEGVGPGAKLEDTLTTLEGFETQYAGATDLVPMVAALRLAGRAVLGPVEEAEKAAGVLLASNDPRTLELLDKAAPILLRNAIDTAGVDQSTSDRWMQLAANTFDRLRAAGRPIPSDARAALAQYYAAAGRLDDAAAAYADLVKEAPQSKTVLRNAADLALRREAWLEAASYLSRLSKLQEVASPGWYDARIKAAESFEKAGRLADACAGAEEVNGFRPDLRAAEMRGRFEDLAARTCR